MLGSRGCSSMVELQPSKLVMRVRFPSPAPLLRALVPQVSPFGPLGNYSFVTSHQAMTRLLAASCGLYAAWRDRCANYATEVRAMTRGGPCKPS